MYHIRDVDDDKRIFFLWQRRQGRLPLIMGYVITAIKNIKWAEVPKQVRKKKCCQILSTIFFVSINQPFIMWLHDSNFRTKKWKRAEKKKCEHKTKESHTNGMLHNFYFILFTIPKKKFTSIILFLCLLFPTGHFATICIKWMQTRKRNANKKNTKSRVLRDKKKFFGTNTNKQKKNTQAMLILLHISNIFPVSIFLSCKNKIK